MIRLEERPFELDGRRYILRCNMAVLERIEDAHEDLEEFFKLQLKTAEVEILAAALNDYAEEQGWDEEWTPSKLKRKVSYAMVRELDLMGMFFRAITPEAAAAAQTAAKAEPEPADEGN